MTCYGAQMNRARASVPTIVLFVSLPLLAGCPTKQAPTSFDQPGGKKVAPPEDKPDKAGTARKPDPKPDSGPPAKARPTVTLRINNETKTHRYTPAGRSMFEGLTLQRQDQGKWVAVPYRPGPCSTRCPTDDRKPSSCRCSPGMPWAGRIPPGKQIEHSWGGVLYVSRTVQGCFCHDEQPAPAGRYRATACVFAEVACAGPEGSCNEKGAEPGWVRNGPGTSGEQRCVSVEFDYKDVDQTVKLVIKE